MKQMLLNSASNKTKGGIFPNLVLYKVIKDNQESKILHDFFLQIQQNEIEKQGKGRVKLENQNGKGVIRGGCTKGAIPKGEGSLVVLYYGRPTAPGTSLS